MSIVVRFADLETDEQLIIDFLAQNHTADSNSKRFDWLYRSGPAGEARVWIAYDSKTGPAIGLAAAFPRFICAGSKQELVWVLGDFCVANQYRSLGPAVELQRACLGGLHFGSSAIYYDFPNASMSAVYRRLGISHAAQMVRLVKPLRVDKKFQSVVRHPHLARIFAAPVNTVLALQNQQVQLPPGFTISVQRTECGSEFTRLAEKIGSTAGICVQRSAEYLNWRYRQHPFRLHETLAVHQRGSLAGYAVVSQEGQHLNLIDLFGKSETIGPLAKTILFIAHQRKLETVAVGILASHPWAKVLRHLGFYERERYPVVVGKLGQGNSTGANDGWLLMNGDRES